MDDSKSLKHYGVLGMKWGVRKKNESSGAPSRRTTASGNKRKVKPSGRELRKKKRELAKKIRNQNRIAKREAKTAKLQTKADEQQRIVDDLRTNGVTSKHMRNAYDDKVGAPGTANDIRNTLRYGGTAKQLLAAQLKTAEKQRDHFLRDAKAVAAGKMTSRQKMLLGTGIAVAAVSAVVVGGVAYGKLNPDGFQAMLDKVGIGRRFQTEFQPGEKLSFDQFWKQLLKTESSRVSEISKDTFDMMEDKDVSLPPGQVFKRISTDPEKELRKAFYAAYTDDDVNRYTATLPKFWEMWGLKGPKVKANDRMMKRLYGEEPPVRDPNAGYEVSMRAIREIKAPSQKKQIQEFINLLDRPIVGPGTRDPLNERGGLNLSKDTPDPVVRTGREWLERESGLFFMMPEGHEKMPSEQLGRAQYRTFMLMLNKFQQEDHPLASQYFQQLRDKGYNAMLDDNDRGKISDNPLFLFDASTTMERMGEKVLTDQDIRNARRTLEELMNRG